jgi:hypothetical protein
VAGSGDSGFIRWMAADASVSRAGMPDESCSTAFSTVPFARSRTFSLVTSSEPCSRPCGSMRS